MSYLTAAKTAKELGITTRTLERWRTAGQFVPQSRTMGGHSRYSHEQVELAKKGIYSNDNVESLLS